MLEAYQTIIERHASTHGVPESWIRAVIMTESSGRASAYREEPAIGDASYGLMQLLLRTARGLGFTGDSQDLFDPEINIGLGTRLLSDLRRRFGSEDFARIYSAYNSGSPDRYLTSPQVATHVGRAQEWLRQFSSDPLALSGAGVFMLSGVAWIAYRTFRRT